MIFFGRNDHPSMIVGQATLGLEIFEQTDYDVLILPTMIDGCGLTAGIALAVKGYKSNKTIIVSEVNTRVIICNRKLFMPIIRIRNA